MAILYCFPEANILHTDHMFDASWCHFSCDGRLLFPGNGKEFPNKEIFGVQQKINWTLIEFHLEKKFEYCIFTKSIFEIRLRKRWTFYQNFNHGLNLHFWAKFRFLAKI